ncbi:MAG: PqqD family protein [Firmicutes bacterium]|nr:PqqD family protein [Bacillota bacterium]
MWKLNDGKMFYDIADGQAVIINYETGMYYGTSLLGSAVLDNILNGAEIGDIVDALKKADGCPDDIEDRVRSFEASLLEREIIVPGTEGRGAEFGGDVFAEGFDFTLDEYAEIQDLLMADPIHEVDVEQGWPVLKEEK